jgi:2'-5' RNA ligase
VSVRRSATRWSESAEDAEREPLSPSARKQGLAVRAFFAISLEGELRERSSALARELAARPGGDGVRWIAPESLHLTLRFLGNVATAELAQLVERAQDAVARCAPFALTLGAPLAFPSPRRAKVVALSAQPESALEELAAQLERAAVAQGLAPEARGFRAHLTLGRVRAQRLPALDAAAPEAAQDVRELVLFRSDLARDGAHYTPLATLALGALGGIAAPGHSPSFT